MNFCLLLGKLNSALIAANNFYVGASKDIDGTWMFGDNFIEEPFYSKLILQPDSGGVGSHDDCLCTMYEPDSDKIKLVSSDCQIPRAVVCRKKVEADPACFGDVKMNVYDLMLNPQYYSYKGQITVERGKQFKDLMKKLNRTAAYETLISTLWHSPLPCFDINGITSGEKYI
jgi:hypothetical protein